MRAGKARNKSRPTSFEGGREYPKRPLVGVGGVVIQDDRVLLVRRARRPLKDEWSIPGGLVEVGERLKGALRRELKEETGLSVRVESILTVVDRITRRTSHNSPRELASHKEERVHYHYVLIDFLCSPIASRSRLRPATDASDARWVRRDDLPKYHLRVDTVRVIEKGFSLSKRQRVEPAGSRQKPDQYLHK